MTDYANKNITDTVATHGDQLLGFIRGRVNTNEDAEDILQDVWFQFSSVVNAQPIEQTGAWLYKVARNKITDKHKKRSESLLDDLFITDSDDDDTSDLQAILMTDEVTPETAYLRNLFWEELFRALDELPEEQRQVFIWQEMDDMTFQEIAEITGVNVNTLVSRKRYAVLHLRTRLQQLYLDITRY